MRARRATTIVLVTGGLLLAAAPASLAGTSAPPTTASPAASGTAPGADAPAAGQTRRPIRPRPPETPPPPSRVTPGTAAEASRVLPERLRHAAIGLVALEQRLGADAPTGAGVRIGMIEGASEGGGWMPRRGRYPSVRFIPESPDPVRGGHADLVARALLSTEAAGAATEGRPGGRAEGAAPGIEQVHVWSSRHWIGDGCLRTGEPAPPRRLPDEVRLLMAAWVADMGPANDEVLARIDALAHGAGALLVSGLPNEGRGLPLPSGATNVLPVGTRAAGHVWSDAAGRPRPELVAPAEVTSTAVAMVTGVAARLHERIDRRAARLRARLAIEAASEEETAARLGLVALARRPEVLRAILMASALRENAYTGRWSGAEASSGLDPRVGAGTVHADRAVRLLDAGQADRTDGAPRGWTAAAPDALPTRGAIPVAEGARELVVVAVWHRVFDESIRNPVLPRRALGLAPPGDSTLAAVTQSASGVAMVRVSDPAPGAWSLVLAGDAAPDGVPATPVAVAWWSDDGRDDDPAPAADADDPAPGGGDDGNAGGGRT